VRTVPTRGRDCRGAARRRVRALRRRSGQLGWAARGRRYGSGRRSSRWRAQGAADGLCAWRQERDPRRGAGKHRCGTCAERALPMVASVASTRSRVAGIGPHQAQCRADRNPLPGRGRAGDRCVNERQESLCRNREHGKPRAPGSMAAATYEGASPHIEEYEANSAAATGGTACGILAQGLRATRNGVERKDKADGRRGTKPGADPH
jgi:hypothetical protein